MTSPVLVLGSNSFSGASFISYAMASGIDVIGCSRSDEAPPVLLPYRWGKPSASFSFHRIDINRDLETLTQLVNRVKPSIIVNYAAQSMVGESWKYPEQWMTTNVVASTALFDRLRHFDFIDRYVHITTPEVYGSTSGFIKEDHPFNPSTPYAVSRAAGDMSLKLFIDHYRFPAVMTRAANIYGPGQPLYRLIPRAIFFLLTGRKLALHGGGASTRSFILADDVSSATLAIARHSEPGDCWHISTQRIVSIREVIEIICGRLGVRFEDAVEIVGERAGKDAAYELDSTKLRSRLGWADRVDLEAGIDATIGWVKSNLTIIKTLPVDYVHKP
jgi:dTDP-glucose 4,6-dehydratase